MVIKRLAIEDSARALSTSVLRAPSPTVTEIMSVPSGRSVRGGEGKVYLEEEREESIRRKRKVSGEANEFSGSESIRVREEKWMHPEGRDQLSKSYRESLLKNVNPNSCWWQWTKNEEDDESEDYGTGTEFAKVLNPLDGICIDLSNPLCPSFEFEEKERERLLKPFWRSLVVKLLGRQLSYGFMVKKLSQLWARKGCIDVFDMENDYFLVNFQHQEDYMDALTGGPWVITDAYLNVTRWRPEFNPKATKIESVVAWVRLPDLPAPLFDKKFLLNLGNSIGKAIRLDVHTAHRARGKFARMCVELDLTKPLIPEFCVDGQIHSIVYESLGCLCTKCGRTGHSKEGCDAFHRCNPAGGMEVEVMGEEKSNEAEKVEERDRWQTVQRTRRPRSNTILKQEQHKGSRFAELNEVTEEIQGNESGSVKMSRGITEKIHREGVSRPLSQVGKPGSKGVTRRGSVLASNRSKGKSVQGSQKRTEGVSKVVLADVSKEISFKENKVGLISQEAAPETCPLVFNSQKTSMKGKENLHPRDLAGLVKMNKEMDTGQLIGAGAAEDPIEGQDMSMEGQFNTPALTD
ncbi:hypothetical protein QN277_005608 [Acacia crassicarpa]|uniref:CCHC-type domain-containing protein n=1 Tax=Acacia crassicarpa TaxID=499986 RepID=A0AAE1IWR7_9FABA|nr:hypothetical protein QN277_005608 [Acacia crassicarpa]